MTAMWIVASRPVGCRIPPLSILCYHYRCQSTKPWFVMWIRSIDFTCSERDFNKLRMVRPSQCLRGTETFRRRMDPKPESDVWIGSFARSSTIYHLIGLFENGFIPIGGNPWDQQKVNRNFDKFQFHDPTFP